MSYEDQIKRALSTGSVLVGSKDTEKAILKGEAKYVFFSKDLEKQTKERFIYLLSLAKVPYVELDRTYKDFGSSLGRDHPIGALVVIKEGKANFSEVFNAQDDAKSTKPAKVAKKAVAAKAKKEAKAKKAKAEDNEEEEDN